MTKFKIGDIVTVNTYFATAEPGDRLEIASIVTCVATVYFVRNLDKPFYRIYFGETFLVALPGPSIGPGTDTLSASTSWGSAPDKYSPSMVDKRLTAEGEQLYREWFKLYKAEGCQCHDSEVCPHCAHPGHPYALEHNTRMWEELPPRTKADAIMDAIREQAGKSST